MYMQTPHALCFAACCSHYVHFDGAASDWPPPATPEKLIGQRGDEQVSEIGALNFEELNIFLFSNPIELVRLLEIGVEPARRLAVQVGEDVVVVVSSVEE